MPVQERFASPPGMTIRSLLTDAREGIVWLPDANGEKNAISVFSKLKELCPQNLV